MSPVPPLLQNLGGYRAHRNTGDDISYLDLVVFHWVKNYRLSFLRVPACTQSFEDSELNAFLSVGTQWGRSPLYLSHLTTLPRDSHCRQRGGIGIEVNTLAHVILGNSKA